MSSNLATDADISVFKKNYFLKASKEGFPLNKQVPLTIQEYTDGGDEDISFDGSNILFVNSTLASGVLNVAVSATDMRNLKNRSITVVADGNTTSNITITLTAPAEFISTAAENGGQTKTIASGSSSISTLFFLSTTKVAVLTDTDT